MSQSSAIAKSKLQAATLDAARKSPLGRFCSWPTGYQFCLSVATCFTQLSGLAVQQLIVGYNGRHAVSG